MAAYQKYQDMVEQLCKGVHQFHAAGHTLKVLLSNATPNPATHTIRGDVSELPATGGYPAGGIDVQNDMVEAGGTATVTGVDVTFTAAGGTIGPFRYAILYNDTPSAPVDPLIGFWDYGVPLTLQDTETFTVDFVASLFTVA